MKKELVLTLLCLSLFGCVPATAILATSTASDVLEMKKVSCMTQYGFMPEFEYGWVDDLDPMHQTPTKRAALTRAYVKRVSKDSYAGRNGISQGDVILKINDQDIFLGEALKRRIHDAMIPSPLWGRAVCASNDRPTTPSCQFFRIINGFFVFTSRPLASSTSQIDLFPVRACPTTLPTNGIDLRSWRATAMTSSCMNCTLSSGSNS